ncbi:MAG: helix-turn-helix transcriptional regulator, partial [Lachnospiraceae bacterium]|nr:helix-turn-helix transcriptional regulator [Lachnospiraceae bacterium]
MDDLKTGTIISKRRKELGLTQNQLAQTLNISFQAVSKWENGTASPDIQTLPKLAA